MKIPKTTQIKKCRLCKNKKLKKIYNFGNHFVSNFVNKASILKGIKAPLNLVYCKKCQLPKRAKVISKKWIQQRKSDFEEWEEERIRVRVLPHQRGKGRCSGSNQIQVETLVEIVWV